MYFADHVPPQSGTVYTFSGAESKATGWKPDRTLSLLLPKGGHPESARKQGREGVVILKFVISLDGSVEDIEVVAGEEPFVASALAAVKAWRYRPASIDGRPTALHHQVRVPFSLRAKS